MGAVIQGRRFGDPKEVDQTDGASGYLNIQPQSSGTAGSIFDIIQYLPNNITNGGRVDPNLGYPREVGTQFRVINASGVDGINMQIWSQFSYDGTSWADNDEGDSVGTWTKVTVGDDITWTKEVVITVQNRYMRFIYDNANAVDPVTVASRVYPKW